MTRRLPLALLSAVLLAGCRTAPRATPPATTGASEPQRLHALLVNGGGRAASNYASHLRHLEAMQDVLASTHLPPGHTTALSADGSDPGLDLATREPSTAEDFWLLSGTPAEAALRPPLTYVTSEVPGLTLKPATRKEITAWATGGRRRFRAGDTVIVFVTDHGKRNPKDPKNNTITLWGDNESISVNELRGLLDGFDPGVRVITVMSQCFSGSFASLGLGRRGSGPQAVCGYFSTTADRLAYGCYPENRNRDHVGHAFHFLNALRRTGNFAEAHRATLVDDASPDVPLRTSDVFLEDVMRRAAQAAGQDPVAFADVWLARAFTDRKAWERDIRLLDAIGERYGIFSPRRLREVEDRLAVVPPIADELKTHRDNWTRSQTSATQANWERFASADTAWAPRLTPQALQNLTPERRQAVTGELLGDLETFTRRSGGTLDRLTSLHERAEDAGSLTYRMETRAGVLLRMRLLLFRVAGMQYVQTQGTPEERTELERLLRCEEVQLPVSPAPGTVEAREPFPSFDDDLAASARVVPGWMGVQFRPATDRQRETMQLAMGAATVQAVYPDSPAKAAGLEIGDVIVGPAGQRFTEPQQLREWVMTAPLDHPIPLSIIRDGTQRQVALTPRAYPRKWPELPGPPKPGTPAPALGLAPYRGTPPVALAGSKETLLFFWATWCGICKTALPELEKARTERGLNVVAITDEEPAQLDTFFASYRGPFPPVVAIDENRRTFIEYGVSGTPTFVLIDPQGRVERHAVGYTKAKGLEVLQGS